MAKSLQDIFSEYTGKTVQVTEEVVKATFSWGEFEETQVTLVESDPVLTALRADFAKAGINNVRIFTPNTFGTADYIESRVNVYIDKADDNVYRIARMGRG